MSFPGRPRMETTPLLARVHIEPASSRSFGTVYHSQPGIHKFLALFLIAALATSVVELALAVTVITMAAHGTTRYLFVDLELEYTLVSFAWTIITCSMVAVLDLVLLRRRGRPGFAPVNFLAFGLGAVVLLCVAGTAISNGAYEPSEEVCTQAPGTYGECLIWASRYAAVMWYYLVFASVLGVEYLILLIAVLVQANKEPSHSRSSASIWNMRGGLLPIEVHVKWGNPQSEGGSSGINGIATASVSAPGRQNDGAAQV